METADTLVALERTLAFGSKMLVGGLIAAGASLLAAILHLMGSTDNIETFTGIKTPPLLAAIAFIVAAVALGLAAWKAIHQGINLLMTGAEKAFSLKAQRESLIAGTIDTSWFNRVQGKLFSCSPILTSPLMVRLMCSVAIFLLASTLSVLQIIFQGMEQPSFFEFIIYGFITGVVISPYCIIIFTGLVMFNPTAYDSGFTPLLIRPYQRYAKHRAELRRVMREIIGE